MGISEIQKNKYALIGQGVENHLSAEIHQIIGDYSFECLNIEDEEELKSVLADKEYSGFIIDRPFKCSIIKHLDNVSDDATSVRAVNIVKREKDGTLSGFNSEIATFKYMMPTIIPGWKAVVLGTGAGARASAEALKNLGAEPIILVSRDPEKAKAEGIIKDFEIIGYNDLRLHKDTKIMVNATPVGKYPECWESPLDGKLIKMSTFSILEIAADLNFNPTRSKFTQDAGRLAGSENNLLAQKFFDNIGARIKGYKTGDMSRVFRENLYAQSRVHTRSGMDMFVRQALVAKHLWLDEADVSEDTDLVYDIKKQVLENQINVVLIGMPGSGKSSIARMMAKELNREFVDTDKLTEELMGEKIQDVLNDESRGELYMRNYETEALKIACNRKGCVIATGGGAVVRPVNRDIIRANGCVVYIKRPVNQLSVKNRPISQKEGVEKLYKERSGIYSRVADVSVTNSHTFGESYDKHGEKNSYTYDLKRFSYKVIKLARDRLWEIVSEHSYKYEEAEKKRRKNNG